jgi:hypothetical protein
MGKIIWLASYPKSGNTWMRVFLHNLLRDPPDGYDINQVSDLSVSDSIPTFYQAVIKRPWRSWSVQDVANARWHVQRHICQRQPDDSFVKTHNAFIEYAGKPMIYKEFTAGALYIVRNPLDVCISLSHHYSCSLDEAIDMLNNPRLGIATNEATVSEVHQNWSKHVKSWTRGELPAQLILRYEDMLDQPLEAFGTVGKFLGLNPPPDRLQRAIANSAFEKLQSQEAKTGFRERPKNAERFFRQGRSGQWRNVLSEPQIKRIVDVHQEQMRRFGYLPLN